MKMSMMRNMINTHIKKLAYAAVLIGIVTGGALVSCGSASKSVEIVDDIEAEKNESDVALKNLFDQHIFRYNGIKYTITVFKPNQTCFLSHNGGITQMFDENNNTLLWSDIKEEVEKYE